MTRLLMLVEGQSEEIFVKRVLTPHLVSYGVHVAHPVVLWTKRLPAGSGFRGGAVGWQQILEDLRRLLRDSDAWVTTMLDYYGLPKDFPGQQAARGSGSAHQKVTRLEAGFAQAINHQRFIPFLVLHEFEAWLFSDPETVADYFGQGEVGKQAACHPVAGWRAGTHQRRSSHASQGALVCSDSRLQGNFGRPHAVAPDWHHGHSGGLSAFRYLVETVGITG